MAEECGDRMVDGDFLLDQPITQIFRIDMSIEFINIEHMTHLLSQCPGEGEMLGVRHDEPRLGILKHRGNPCQRIGGIQRYVDLSRLQDRQDHRDQASVMFQQQCNRFLVLTPQSEHSMGHSICFLVQRLVGEYMTRSLDGQPVRISTYLLLKTSWYRLLDVFFSELDEGTARMKALGLNSPLLWRKALRNSGEITHGCPL